MSTGLKIKQNWMRVDQAVIKTAKNIDTSLISDVMGRLPGTGPLLRPMHTSGNLIGSALTVRTRPGDNLMLHKAIDMANPGDVIVCDAGGDTTNALMGELMLVHAIQRGVAGFVLNGAIRDAEGFLKQNLPTYAVGINHKGPYRDGIGEIGFPISINGMVIQSGDLIVGDYDGVVCLPINDAQEIIKRAKAKGEAEDQQMKVTIAGKIDRSWVDKALQSKGCIFID